MLTYSVIGPAAHGHYHVVYSGPHTKELTSVYEVWGHAAAKKEAARLNAEQLAHEKALQEERRLCGIRRVR